MTSSAAVTSMASRKRTDRTDATMRRNGEDSLDALREAIAHPHDRLDGLPGARLGKLAAQGC